MSSTDSTAPLLEETFPLSTIFCVPSHVDFLIIAISIATGIMINQLVIFRLFSDEWLILKHIEEPNKLPVRLKWKLFQFHQAEGVRVAAILLTFIPNQDVVDLICYFLDNTDNPNSPRSRARSRSRSPSPCPMTTTRSTPLSRHSSTKFKFNLNVTVTAEQMTKIINNPNHEVDAVWKDEDVLHRYLSCYCNRVVSWSAMYSVIVVGSQMVTLIVVIYEFIHWTIVDDTESVWDYYNGFCICLALLHPFLKYYKLHPFFTTDFGNYNPHHVSWHHIHSIADNEWHKLSILENVTMIQLFLSIVLGLLWIPLLPGALLFLLMIFCFITALGVPFFILYSAFTYLHECYFHQVTVCHRIFQAMHHIVVHSFILIALSSVHFCHYRSVLTTSYQLYRGADVLGCTEKVWDWRVHEWHWRNLWIILAWILL